jgi:hypothetical protein
MTRGGILEYREAVRWRYLNAGKKEKGKIPDEFTQVTGFHRKAAIRLLHRQRPRVRTGGRGRCSRYGYEVAEALRKVWEASDRLCAQRLKPLVGEMVSAMRHHGELAVDAQIEADLCRMGPATMERLKLVYDTLPLHINLFQPTMKLVSRSRQGARVHKVYDYARTPYQRLVESGVLTEARQAELAAIYRGLNPARLLKQLNGHLEQP